MLSRLCVAAVAALGVACGEDELVCVEIDPSCAPLYAPTWANVVTTTLVPKCGAAGCHTAAARKGGLVLDDAATAYDHLVGGGYVIPGDAACSELTERIFAASSSLRMPRGSPLPAAEACAVARWVAAGAPGPSPVTREAP